MLQFSFLCPNGTLFQQEYLVCDWWFNVDCSVTRARWYIVIIRMMIIIMMIMMMMMMMMTRWNINTQLALQRQAYTQQQLQ